MFKGYGDEHHPMVEEWRTGYGYEVRGNLKSNKADTFRACDTWNGCAQDDIIIKVTIIAGSPTAPRAHIDPFQTCIIALAVPYASTSSLATTAEHIYVKKLWSW